MTTLRRINVPSGARQGEAIAADYTRALVEAPGEARPTSLGCRITGLARPELVVEVEVTAVECAGAGITRIGPDPVDPLDAG